MRATRAVGTSCVLRRSRALAAARVARALRVDGRHLVQDAARDRRRTRPRPLPEHLDLGAYREVFATMPVGRYLAVTVAWRWPSRCSRSRSRCPPATRSPSCASSGAALRVRRRCSRACSSPRRPRSSRCSCSSRSAPRQHDGRARPALRRERARHLPRAPGAAQRARRDHRGRAHGRRRRAGPSSTAARADAPADARVAVPRQLRLPLQRLLLAAGDDDRRLRCARCRSASPCSASRARACAGTS